MEGNKEYGKGEEELRLLITARLDGKFLNDEELIKVICRWHQDALEAALRGLAEEIKNIPISIEASSNFLAGIAGGKIDAALKRAPRGKV